MASRTRVLVLPGLATSDTSTQIIRTSLASRGHRPHRWRLGRNEGPTDKTTQLIVDRLLELYGRENQRVALVGWSLGGLYAHWVARSRPELVHSVVTLGSPLSSPGNARPKLLVPTTSIYSRNDRIVPWERSLIDDSARRHENIEVRTTHIGLGFDPATLHLINDRVGTDPATWSPFKPPLLLRAAFPAGR